MITNVSIYNGRVMGYLTSAQFAKVCGVKKSTVHVWIKRGKIPGYFLLKIGNDWWINCSCPKIERKNKRKEL